MIVGSTHSERRHSLGKKESESDGKLSIRDIICCLVPFGQHSSLVVWKEESSPAGNGHPSVRSSIGFFIRDFSFETRSLAGFLVLDVGVRKYPGCQSP